MTQFEASQPENRDQVMNNLHSNIKQVKNPRILKIGDRVRIYAYKSTFTKVYMPRWTKEIFVIDEIMKTNPIAYKIKDLNGEPILRKYTLAVTNGYGSLTHEGAQFELAPPNVGDRDDEFPNPQCAQHI